MKKIFYTIGIAMLFASCSDSYTDWATPHSSQSETTVTVSFSAAQAANIDYGTYTADSVQLFVPTVSSTASKTVTTYRACLYNADKSDSLTVSTDANGKITTAELKTIVEKLYGKRPVEHAIPVNATALTVIDGQSLKNMAATQLSVKLKAPFIDTAYYLTGDIAEGWDKAHTLKFAHSGADVYDDPVFTLYFTTTATDKYWKIIPATNYNGNFWAEGEKGVLGTAVNGDAALTGQLTTSSPQAGKVATAGLYQLKLNMLEYSYTFTPLTLGLIGGATPTGWDSDTDFTYNATDKCYEISSITLTNGEIKVRANDAWEHDWGGTLANMTYKGGNITVTAGTYKVQFFLNADGTGRMVLTP